MTRLQEFALIAGILLLGTFAILTVADGAIARQDLIMQESRLAEEDMARDDE